MAYIKCYFKLLLLVFCSYQHASAATLTLYSARKEHLLKPVLEAYTQKSGVTFKLITNNEGALIQRLKIEADQSPADMLITVDAGNLWFAKKQNLLTAVDSKLLNKKIPANFRDEANFWFGLSIRARTIVYHREFKVDAIKSYQDLSKAEFKNLLCLRTSKKVYNHSLVAMLIDQYGKKEVESMLRGWVSNTKQIFNDDNAVIEAISSKRCQIGIVNTYYLAKKHAEKLALNVLPHFISNDGKGLTHVNISGIGITKASRHKELAINFLEWLVSDEAQAIFAAANFEYPVVENIKLDPILSQWGNPHFNHTFDLNKLGELQPEAIMLMNAVRYK
jgi:iron(III) transport system substrate-binding protein